MMPEYGKPNPCDCREDVAERKGSIGGACGQVMLADGITEEATNEGGSGGGGKLELATDSRTWSSERGGSD